MIRFKTVEPDSVPKPEKTLPAAPVRAPAGDVASPADAESNAAKPKGMTRKTPLRAKKPEGARLFEG